MSSKYENNGTKSGSGKKNVTFGRGKEKRGMGMGMGMRRTGFLIVVAGVLGLGLMSCTLGTPPECALQFSIGTADNNGAINTIPFTIENIGSVDLTDCKILLYITINNDIDPGPAVEYYTFNAWTTGVSLSVGETYNGNYQSPYTEDIIAPYQIVAAGFANPEDETSSYSIVTEVNP